MYERLGKEPGPIDQGATMTRNLKVLIAAALALVACGAFSASSAQAADELHCSVSPCRFRGKQAGTGTTGHQVFIIENVGKTESVSFTCHEVTGEGTFSGFTTTNVIISIIEYHKCTVNGSPGVTVDMNGCSYKFTATAAGTTDGDQLHVECPVGKKIQYTIPEIGCTFEIGPQTLNGVGYHTLGTTPNREITVTIKSTTNIAVTRNAGCAALIKAEALIGTYTTGNWIMTGESDDGNQTMADLWWS
jgi:hypothetical protein